MRTLLIILVVLSFGTITQAQTIEKYSIDSGGNSVTAGDIEILYTIGEVNIQELNTGIISVSEGFINAELKILINPQVFLQGPILDPNVSNQMNDNLRAASLIPNTSPYPDAATCNASVFNTIGANAIVDWVYIELRASNDNTKIINARSALLQRDGDIVDVNGTSSVSMQAAPTNYFIVINHRNHLGVMSGEAIGLSDSSVATVDFRDINFSTYGTNAQAQLQTNNMALWAGDVNGNNQVRYLGPGNDSSVIKNKVINESGNTTGSNYYPFSGYNNADVNMNGQIRYLGPSNDSAIIKNIIINHPGNTTLSNYFPIQISF